MLNYSINLYDLEYFLCILFRVSLFTYSAPFFGQRGVPNQVKIAFSFFVSALLYGVIGPDRTPLEYETVYGYATIILKEALTGLVIGVSANICTTIIDFAGRIMDMETGLSMANLIDPTTGLSSSISGVMYQYAIILMLIVSGMHRYLIQALAETFRLIPVNGAVFSSDRLLESMLVFLKDYVTIGFRICLPIFAVMIILNAVLGVMTKVSPQLNMFAVGMQIKVLTGLCVLFFTVGMLPSVSNFIFQEMKNMMTSFVNAML